MLMTSFKRVKVGSTFYIDQVKKYVKMSSKEAFGDKGKIDLPQAFRVYVAGSEVSKSPNPNIKE